MPFKVSDILTVHTFEKRLTAIFSLQFGIEISGRLPQMEACVGTGTE